VVIAGMKAAASIILPFFIAAFIAMISFPLLNWLQNKRVPTALALLATLLAVISVLTAFGFLVAGSISGFTAQVPKYQAQLEQMFSGVLAWLQARGIETDEITTLDFLNPARAMNLVTGSLRALTAVLSNLLLVFLTIVFLLLEAAGFPAKFQKAFGTKAASGRLIRIQTEVQRYLAIKTSVSLATGGLVAVSLSIIGVDFPLLWGALAFLANYIPSLGSIIAAVPPTLLALVQLGSGRAIAVAAVFLTVNLTLGNFLEPHLMGRRLGLSTLVVFLSLVFWGWIWGPVGMFLSVPLTMIIKIAMENTKEFRWIAVLLDAGPKPEASPS
jgi:AI-2 transport protein TqsA